MFEINDLEMLDKLECIYDNKIVLYGAGDYGNRAFKLLERIGVSVYGICDSDKAKWGRPFKNRKIMSIQELGGDLCGGEGYDHHNNGQPGKCDTSIKDVG